MAADRVVHLLERQRRDAVRVLVDVLERQSGIDAFIWHRHVDHAKEGGLRVGLWTFKPGTIFEPDRKRLLYDLFKKAETAEWNEAAKFALPIVGLKSWDELIR